MEDYANAEVNALRAERDRAWTERDEAWREHDRLRTALEHIAYQRQDGTPHDTWTNREERIAREALGLPNVD